MNRRYRVDFTFNDDGIRDGFSRYYRTRLGALWGACSLSLSLGMSAVLVDQRAGDEG